MQKPKTCMTKCVREGGKREDSENARRERRARLSSLFASALTGFPTASRKIMRGAERATREGHCRRSRQGWLRDWRNVRPPWAIHQSQVVACLGISNLPGLWIKTGHFQTQSLCPKVVVVFGVFTVIELILKQKEIKLLMAN